MIAKKIPRAYSIFGFAESPMMIVLNYLVSKGNQLHMCSRLGIHDISPVHTLWLGFFGRLGGSK